MRKAGFLGISALALTSAAAQAAQDRGIGNRDLEDIIVTATKTETVLQKTPQAITAIDGRTLSRAGIFNAQSLNKLVSGLQIEQNSSQASIFIRGVGSRALSSSSDPAIAFSVDGVYYARSTGPTVTFFDVARVEVVKGPQGTLYGRNATGGAVNLVTNQPKLGDRSLDISLEVGNYTDVHGEAAVNLPLGEHAALRIAGQSTYRNGYLSDGYNDDDIKAVRASLLVEPSSDFSAQLSGDYAHQGGMGSGAVPIGGGATNGALTTRFVVPGEPLTGPSDPRVTAFIKAAIPPAALPIPGPLTRCVGVPFGGAPAAPGVPALITCTYPFGATGVKPDGFLNNRYYGASLTLNGRLGFADLTGIGAYRASRVDALTYGDWKPQRQRVNSDQYTAEVRLASHPGAGALKWIVGGFYLKEKINSDFVISSGDQAVSNPFPSAGSPLPATTCSGPLGPPPGTPGVCLATANVIKHNFETYDPDIENESYAAFGQATLTVVKGVRLTAGIRYTHDTKSEVGGRLYSYYLAPAGVVDSFPTQGSVAFKNTSYRAGAEIDAGAHSLLYATFATAYHAGGFNAGVQQGPNAYAYSPEHVQSYVVGAKTRFLHNILQVNVEGFWIDYTNYQTASLGRVNDGSMACSVLLLATSCALNLRTDNAAAARSRGVEADIVLKATENGTFTADVLYNQARFRKFLLPAFPAGFTNYSGYSLPGAPDWTVTAGYVQNFPLQNGGRIVAEARSQYRSGTWMFYVHAPGNYQTAYTRTDLSLGYVSSARWSITAFVRNLENRVTLLQGGPVEGGTNVPFNGLNPPRTFGAILSAHF